MAIRSGEITPAGVITTNLALPTPGGPFGITAGSDGNLWFTEEAGNKIGEITTSGVITETPTPTTPSALLPVSPQDRTATSGLWKARGTKSGSCVKLPTTVTGALTAASDSGSSHTDDITNVNTPTFAGTTKPLAVVQLFAQRSDQTSPTMIGMATAAADGKWSITATNPVDRMGPIP